jgi:hypothetical protein
MVRVVRLFQSALLAFSVCGLAGLADAKASDTPGFEAKKDGTLVHRASHYRFPLQLAGFTRDAVVPFDVKGHDVAVTYQKTVDGNPVIARIALIHIIAMTPKEHFLGLKGTVGHFFKEKFTNIAQRGEGPFTPPGASPSSGYQGRFSVNLDGTPYELSLSTVKLGYWDSRLTAAYPAAVAPQAQQEILSLATALQAGSPKAPRKP